ncbi:MAG: cystathionine gamma-synthase [Candidatus Eisenbacteria bacterium]|nr:cystathionine gamma-synthase [Candidatus Eisenbacteria bacterium]
MGFSTDAIHAGQEPDPTTGAVTIPIYQTSTYVQEELGKHKGFEYARTQNPTRFALERNIAALEKGKRGFAFSSGMAAISACMYLLKAGDHVIVTNNVYGGTFRLFDKILKSYGLAFDYIDTSSHARAADAIRPNTKMLFVETPTNPLLIVTDLSLMSKLAREKGIMLVVDNTFMTPYFQRPLELGATIVVHSTTKYLNGHSDMVGGVVVTSEDEIAERLGFIQNAVGAVPGPFDCWLVLRGTKTLSLRMERHNENAAAIAKLLAASPKVVRVVYPGLPSHPQHELMKKQCTGFGGMVTLDLGGIEEGKRLLKSVRLFSLAESLGGVESLISHPATMTHASVPKEEREKMGLTDGLVRLSVGVEDKDDLIEDLRRGLAQV